MKLFSDLIIFVCKPMQRHVAFFFVGVYNQSHWRESCGNENFWRNPFALVAMARRQ